MKNKKQRIVLSVVFSSVIIGGAINLYKEGNPWTDYLWLLIPISGILLLIFKK